MSGSTGTDQGVTTAHRQRHERARGWRVDRRRARVRSLDGHCPERHRLCDGARNASRHPRAGGGTATTARSHARCGRAAAGHSTAYSRRQRGRRERAGSGGARHAAEGHRVDSGSHALGAERERHSHGDGGSRWNGQASDLQWPILDLPFTARCSRCEGKDNAGHLAPARVALRGSSARIPSAPGAAPRRQRGGALGRERARGAPRRGRTVAARRQLRRAPEGRRDRLR